MAGVVICFTGFKSKEELHHLCSLAHLMGASIRKDMAAVVTHIVAHAVSGSKYKVCGKILHMVMHLWYSHGTSVNDEPYGSGTSRSL